MRLEVASKRVEIKYFSLQQSHGSYFGNFDPKQNKTARIRGKP